MSLEVTGVYECEDKSAKSDPLGSDNFKNGIFNGIL